MRTLAFDGRMGASGDMVLGALLDAGADPDVLDPVAADLDVAFDIDRRVVNGIDATDVTVTPAGGGHGADREAGDAEGHGPHRRYEDVLDIVEGMAVPSSVEGRARSVFSLIAEAEATVHGTTVEAIHFHAVGADDAIADVVGAAALFDDLDADRVVTGAVSAGGGEVETSHGTYPVPPPAVAEIAARTDLVLDGGPIADELLTPTGAALLGVFATHVERLPALDIDAVGYGAGSRSYEARPNVLRVTAGTAVGELRQEPIRMLETNVDDVSPELLGHLQETLLDAGARDVTTAPLTMKKSRPGHLVRVVVDPADEARIARRLAAETGTLGVRSGQTTHRWVAEREVRTVTIEIGGESYRCDVKIAADQEGTIIDRSAEFDDAAEIGRQTSRPTREIMQRAERAAAELE